jgi:TPR repeat protein
MRSLVAAAMVVPALCGSTLAQESFPRPSPSPSPAVQAATDDDLALAEKANQGDPVAQSLLGDSLRLAGRYSDAAAWYRKASDQGSASAQGSLGRLYMTGSGVPQDFDQALRWSKAGALNGDPEGALCLAMIYRFGKGVPIDNTEAATWARRAAEQDCARMNRPLFICAQAQLLLAAAYFNGEGVPKDYMWAYVWANLAAAAIPLDERNNAVTLGYLAQTRMTPKQMGDALRLLHEWKPTATK